MKSIGLGMPHYLRQTCPICGGLKQKMISWEDFRSEAIDLLHLLKELVISLQQGVSFVDTKSKMRRVLNALNGCCIEAEGSSESVSLLLSAVLAMKNEVQRASFLSAPPRNLMDYFCENIRRAGELLGEKINIPKVTDWSTHQNPGSKSNFPDAVRARLRWSDRYLCSEKSVNLAHRYILRDFSHLATLLDEMPTNLQNFNIKFNELCGVIDFHCELEANAFAGRDWDEKLSKIHEKTHHNFLVILSRLQIEFSDRSLIPTSTHLAILARTFLQHLEEEVNVFNKRFQ